MASPLPHVGEREIEDDEDQGLGASFRERLCLSWQERYGRRGFWKETLHAYIYLFL